LSIWRPQNADIDLHFMIGLANGQHPWTMCLRAAESRRRKIAPFARDKVHVTAKLMRALLAPGAFSCRSRRQFRESGSKLRAHNSHMNCHLFWRVIRE